MLVIVSDLHLTDGSLSETVSPGAFALFAERIREMAVAASWRAEGDYRPIESIELVLLGDVLDPIRSTRWEAAPKVRPWGNPHAPELVEQISRITSDILGHNEESLAVLRALAAEGGVTVPPKFRAGHADADAERQAVPVRIFYMVGNHDWFYHLPGRSYDGIREALMREMGLAGKLPKPFPHDMLENDELLQAMRRHKVVARHGDQFDPLCYEGDRDASSLGDVIVIELLNRFVTTVCGELAEELPPATLLGLRELDNVRPLLLIPVWLDGLLERTCPFPATRKQVKSIWDGLVDEFLAIRFVRERDGWGPFDLVDGLERTLKFSKRLSIGWASSVVEWLHKLRGVASASYCHHALAEQDFRNRRARHIVYGHTHMAESVPLDASYAEGYVLDQTYFNAGTWRRVHRQTQMAPAEHEFIGHDTMRYLAFFQGDERKGRPYETWSGTLGFSSTASTVYRLDPGKATLSHASGKSVSAPNLHQHAPHFSASPAHARSASPPRLRGV